MTHKLIHFYAIPWRYQFYPQSFSFSHRYFPIQPFTHSPNPPSYSLTRQVIQSSSQGSLR